MAAANGTIGPAGVSTSAGGDETSGATRRLWTHGDVGGGDPVERVAAPGTWTGGRDRTRRCGRGSCGSSRPSAVASTGVTIRRHRRLRRRLGERLEQRAAPGLVALGRPPAQHQRVDRVGVRVAGRTAPAVSSGSRITNPVMSSGFRVPSPGTRSATHSSSSSSAGSSMPARRRRRRRPPATPPDDAITATPRTGRRRSGRDLRQQLGAGRAASSMSCAVEHARVAEHEVVDPALVGDGAGVRLHDVARALGAAELERHHGLAGDRARGRTAAKNALGVADLLDDEADDAVSGSSARSST